MGVTNVDLSSGDATAEGILDGILAQGGGGAGAAPPSAAAPAAGLASDPSFMMRQLGNPEMLKMMKRMLTTMPPEQLEQLSQQMGVRLTPEMVRKLDSISDKTVERVAWALNALGKLLVFLRAVARFLRSRAVFALALLALILAILYKRSTSA